MKIKNPFNFRDVFVLGGILMIGVGIGTMHIPAALVVTGFLLFFIGMKRGIL